MGRLNDLLSVAAHNVKFGQLSVDLEVHNGKVRAVQGSEHMERHYPGDGYQEAVDHALQLLAGERNSQKSGTITFSYEIKGGQVKRLFVHRQFKHLLTDR